MSARKPLDEGCIGGVWCPVPGHVVRVSYRYGRFTIKHTPLTQGQEKTLYERQKAARATAHTHTTIPKESA